MESNRRNYFLYRNDLMVWQMLAIHDDIEFANDEVVDVLAEKPRNLEILL